MTQIAMGQTMGAEMGAEYWVGILKDVSEGRSLSQDQAGALMQGWLAEAVPPLLSGAILMALNAKGFSGVELAGMAQVLKSLSAEQTVMTHLNPVVDTCGTGGDGADTFNISTAVAFIVAATGLKVAKHGGRSSSSRVGSADVLEGLGLNFGANPAKIRSAVDEVGVTFLFAPGWHPAMKSVAPIRKALGIRTVFNLLGPLVNPMNPTGQVIGVSRSQFLDPMAEALGLLGVEQAIVVLGREGLDEACLGDLNDLAVLGRSGEVTREILDPQAVGAVRATVADLKGGDLAENMAILRSVLQGKGTIAQTDAVALNAALALRVGDRVLDLSEGVSVARDVILSGTGWSMLEKLMAFLK